MEPWLQAGAPGFRVSVTTLCDILAEEPFVSNVSKPNASDPCTIDIEVRSVAGCAELDLDIAWLIFMVAAFATVAVVLLSSALRLLVTGECGFMEPPKAVSTVLSVVWAALAAARDLACVCLLRPFMPSMERRGREAVQVLIAAGTVFLGPCGGRCMRQVLCQPHEPGGTDDVEGELDDQLTVPDADSGRYYLLG